MYLLVIAIELTGAGCCLCKARCVNFGGVFASFCQSFKVFCRGFVTLYLLLQLDESVLLMILKKEGYKMIPSELSSVVWSPWTESSPQNVAEMSDANTRMAVIFISTFSTYPALPKRLIWGCDMMSQYSQHCHGSQGRIPPGAPPWMVAAGVWDAQQCLGCRMKEDSKRTVSNFKRTIGGLQWAGLQMQVKPKNSARFRLDQAGFDKGSSCRRIVCNSDTGVRPTQFTHVKINP